MYIKSYKGAMQQQLHTVTVKIWLLVYPIAKQIAMHGYVLTTYPQ